MGAPNNAGYDDENGSYLLVAHDHIAYRYEVLKVIGKGSFGQVRMLFLSLFFTLSLNWFVVGDKGIRSQVSTVRCTQIGEKREEIPSTGR